VAPGPRCWRAGWAVCAARAPRQDAREERIARLEREKRELEQEPAKARFVVEVQAKLHALLETISESEQPERGSTP
jgi:transposase